MQKTKIQPAKKIAKNELIEKVQALFTDYLDTTSAIMEDYVTDPEMDLEIGAADKNFIAAVDSLESDLDDESGFENIMEKLKALDSDDLDEEVLWEFMENEWDLKDYFISEGYAVIKIDTMDARDKLEDFVKREIWPFVNDQKLNMAI